MIAVSEILARRKLSRGVKLAAVVIPVALLGACAQNPPPQPAPVQMAPAPMAPAPMAPPPSSVPPARG